MKRRIELGSSQNIISNEANKRCKLACDPILPSTTKLGTTQKRMSCKHVDDQGNVHNLQESSDVYSVNFSSSPLHNVSVHSQEDLSQSYQSLDYLRKKLPAKAARPDTDEENLYFKKDSSCSEDEIIVKTQPSTPNLATRKQLLDYFKDRATAIATCSTSSRKKKEKTSNKTKNSAAATCSVNSLVNYEVGDSSQSSSSRVSSSYDEGELSSSSSSDEDLPRNKGLLRATTPEYWRVKSVIRNKSKPILNSTASQPKTPLRGHFGPSNSVITSKGNYPVQNPSAANLSAYSPQARYSKLDGHINKETVSPKGYGTQHHYKSPEFCNISTRTSYQSSRRHSIGNYDTDEIFRDNNPNFIDTHCHLDFLFRKQRFNGSWSKYRLINRDSFPKSYEGCLAVFCEPETFAKKHTWDYLLEDDGVWGAFGCHPKMANGYNDSVEQHLLAALQSQKVVALGEIGLDYSTYNFSDIEVQKSVFRKQLKIATDRQLPLVIHSRDANKDTFAILKEMVPHNHRIHRHCFTGSWTEAQEWLDSFPNLYIGLTPLVTFPSARDVHETAQKIPLNRLLLETDAPYFMPKILQIPGEKQCSHPGMAIHVAAQVAAMRFTSSLNDVLLAARKNTEKMYGI